MKVEGDDDQRDEAARLAARGIAALEALAARLDMIASVAAVALQAHSALERIAAVLESDAAEPSPVVSYDTAGQMLGCDTCTVRAYVRQGRLRSAPKHGRSPRVFRADVVALVVGKSSPTARSRPARAVPTAPSLSPVPPPRAYPTLPKDPAFAESLRNLKRR